MSSESPTNASGQSGEPPAHLLTPAQRQALASSFLRWAGESPCRLVAAALAFDALDRCAFAVARRAQLGLKGVRHVR